MKKNILILIFTVFLLKADCVFAQTAYVTTGNAGCSVINTVNNTIVANIALNAGPDAVVASPDGTKSIYNLLWQY